jgi:hypothetical protein
MHIRNLPDTPGALLGHMKNGRPFYLAAGGAEGDGESGTEGAPAGSGDAGTPPAGNGTGAGSQEPAPAGSSDGGTQGADGGAAQPDDRTSRTIAAIREDFKAERSRRQQTEKALADFKAESEQREQTRAQAETERNKKLAVALGVAAEDEPPDPAKLAEELERTRTANQAAADALKGEIRQRDLRLAVLTQAPSQEANGLLLMDSLSFLRKLDGLDPAAEDFSEKVGDAIKAAAEANPQYKLNPPKPAGDQKPPPSPARSGGEFNGAPGGNRQWTVEDVDRASPSEVAKAQEDGLLVNLGFNPRKSRR